MVEFSRDLAKVASAEPPSPQRERARHYFDTLAPADIAGSLSAAPWNRGEYGKANGGERVPTVPGKARPPGGDGSAGGGRGSRVQRPLGLARRPVPALPGTALTSAHQITRPHQLYGQLAVPTAATLPSWLTGITAARYKILLVGIASGAELSAIRLERASLRCVALGCAHEGRS